jgi:hypothetical protein
LPSPPVPPPPSPPPSPPPPVVGRRARWRAPRRERKRSHSTPTSRDDDGVE